VSPFTTANLTPALDESKASVPTRTVKTWCLTGDGNTKYDHAIALTAQTSQRSQARTKRIVVMNYCAVNLLKRGPTIC
jgi:hypothetical protein